MHSFYTVHLMKNFGFFMKNIPIFLTMTTILSPMVNRHYFVHCDGFLKKAKSSSSSNVKAHTRMSKVCRFLEEFHHGYETVNATEKVRFNK